MYGSSFEGMFAAMIGLAMLAGAAVCGIVFWLAPMLWHWVKPWLHMATG